MLDRSDFNADALVALDGVADAAKRGDWPELLGRLNTKPEWVNRWRPGGGSWFTPLHQAAWHGAPRGVVDALLARGAWRSLRTAKGERAADVALRKGHRELAEYLAPQPVRQVQPELVAGLDEQVRLLVESRIRPHLKVQLRCPSVEVMGELEQGRLWFPVLGMYGGFALDLRNGYLYVQSWSRVVGGSGQAHVVTARGHLLVEEGFV